jgi:predicted transglutaminase-like cysteine proteinase
VDPNRIDGFNQYWFPAENIAVFSKAQKRLPLETGQMSHTKLNVATLAIAGSIFVYAMSVNLAYPSEYAATGAMAEGANTSATFLARADTDAPSTQRFDSAASEAPGGTEHTNREPPALTPVQAPAYEVNGGAGSAQTLPPTRTAFFSLPRLLNLSVARLSFRTPSLPPMSFMRFCIRYPDDCKVSEPLFRPKPVSLTTARRAELVQVNREVNRAIRPQANTNGVMAEEWLVSPREGDCNDYAVTKRHELLQRGWPSRTLLLAEVVVASGEHHLVLVVRTREDDLVLDNLNWNVRPVAQIQYGWVRAQQANNPKFWSNVDVARATHVAMNGR